MQRNQSIKCKLAPTYGDTVSTTTHMLLRSGLYFSKWTFSVLVCFLQASLGLLMIQKPMMLRNNLFSYNKDCTVFITLNFGLQQMYSIKSMNTFLVFPFLTFCDGKTGLFFNSWLWMSKNIFCKEDFISNCSNCCLSLSYSLNVRLLLHLRLVNVFERRLSAFICYWLYGALLFKELEWMKWHRGISVSVRCWSFMRLLRLINEFELMI